MSSAASLQRVLGKPDPCLFCSSTKHRAEVCDDETNLTVKKQILTKDGRCFRWFKQGHMARDCWGRQKCDRCSRRHVTSMRDLYFQKKANEASATATNLLSNKRALLYYYSPRQPR
ncbi:hypothetical protein HPB50_017273 [Hyalomma asiaticum]|uniref:Uncharacterized protein n=1 Tax=Hyalomma asiaticum TaxID=266040 RepID=A0ACB7SZL9_HYAAI|nr:hypothetical protein HPB50_017273 [Hyalomma asiaticum]